MYNERLMLCVCGGGASDKDPWLFLGNLRTSTEDGTYPSSMNSKKSQTGGVLLNDLSVPLSSVAHFI